MDSHDNINALIQQTQSLECSDLNTNECTIIARILSEKPTNLGAFKTTILKAWNPKNRVTTNQLQQNLMAFVFEDPADVDKITNLSWSFRDSQIIIQRWPPDKALHDIDLNKATFWIQAFNIPVCFINLPTAELIGNSVGQFLKTDLNSSSQRWKKSL